MSDLLVHDCRYADTEFKTRIGWGHSSFEYTIAVASWAGVKMAATYCIPGRYGDIEVFFAREGRVIAL